MNILLVEGDFGLTEVLLTCLKGIKGVCIHIVSRQKRKGFLRGNSYHFFSNAGDEQFLDHIKATARATGATVLLAADEADSRFIIMNQGFLQTFINVMPLPSLEIFDMARNKRALANFMQARGLNIPRTVENLSCLDAAIINSLSFPGILKPTIGHGGIGMILIKKKEELAQQLSKMNICDSYILQEYIEGYNMGCSVLYADGRLIAHTVQKGLIPGRTIFESSMGLEFLQDEGVVNMVDDLMQRLHWSGLANLDMRYDIKRNKVWVLEINPRVWFTMPASLKATGINFAQLACELAQNKQATAPVARTGRYIPLSVWIKNKMNGKAKGIHFAWRDIDVRTSFRELFLGLLLYFQKNKRD